MNSRGASFDLYICSNALIRDVCDVRACVFVMFSLCHMYLVVDTHTRLVSTVNWAFAIEQLFDVVCLLHFNRINGNKKQMWKGNQKKVEHEKQKKTKTERKKMGTNVFHTTENPGDDDYANDTSTAINFVTMSQSNNENSRRTFSLFDGYFVMCAVCVPWGVCGNDGNNDDGTRNSYVEWLSDERKKIFFFVLFMEKCYTFIINTPGKFYRF